jgi:hypothetical protein
MRRSAMSPQTTKLPALALSVVLATMLHIDWHLARPMHHRLSLDWRYHWLATALVFAIVGWIIARHWPSHRWTLGLTVFVAAVILAQGIEPILEVLLYQQRLGYPDEPARWVAFGQSMAVAAPLYFGALLLCARPATALRVIVRER